MPAPAQGTAAPRPQWKRTWGAIAADGVSAALGTASGEDSKRRAEKAALQRCRDQGGTQCVLDVSYYDQCAVLVTGKSQVPGADRHFDRAGFGTRYGEMQRSRHGLPRVLLQLLCAGAGRLSVTMRDRLRFSPVGGNRYRKDTLNGAFLAPFFV